MTTETDQAAGQLDEATVLRVLEMLHEMEAAAAEREQGYSGPNGQMIVHMMAGAGVALNSACDRLVAMYRASLGIEEA